MSPFSPVEALGAVAGLLTTVSFVPQVVKTLRTRHTADISLAMWVMFSVGVVLWTVYGALIGSWPIIAANLPTLAMALVILRTKLGNLGRD
jgi:MtN3 and saliva related transmembrane protein